MPNKKQRQQNANTHRTLMAKVGPLHRCPNCLVFIRDGHFAPPSLGEDGFFTCKKTSL